MINKKTIYALLAVFTVFLFCGCEKETVPGGECKVSLYIDADLSLEEVLSKAAPPEDMIFSVKILDGTGKEVYNFPNHKEMPQTVTVQPGSYKAVAVTNRNGSEAAFDQPVYSGETAFTAKIGTNSNVKISCAHACIKVTVGYSDAIKALLKEYKTVVTDGTVAGTLVFEGGETRAGYFAPTGQLTYTLQAVTNQNEDFTASRTLETLKAADYLNIVFDVKEDQSGDDDNSIIDIVVDETVNDVQHYVNITLNKGTPPTVTANGFDAAEIIQVYNPVVVPTTLSVASPEGLVGLYLKFLTDLSVKYGLPQTVNLVTADPDMVAALRQAGVTFTLNDTKTQAELDLSGATALLSYNEDTPKDHTIEIMAMDSHKQFVALPLRFRVFSKIHKAVNAQLFESQTAGHDRVVLTARYVTESVPEGLGLVYKEKNAVEWTQVTADMATMLDNKRYAYTVELPQNTEYVFRTALIVNGVVTEMGDAEIAFTTVPAVVVPNLNFDTWHQSGKSWYPNASGGNSFWATGNDGITGFPVNKDSNTYPVEGDEAISGKAVKMTSISVPVVNFAAGNLFTGTYKTNISDPASSVKFGREFTGRPTHLTGYYKYQPADYNGGKDYCHIYIKLENRSNGNVTVGYAELKDNRTMSQYETFSLKVKYTSDLPVTHITLVATSSVDGGDFKGGLGSTLWVDEFQMLYLYE